MSDPADEIPRDDPIAALLQRLPDRLRATVESARDSGDWAPAKQAILAAARATPGPRHIDYARLLLGLDEFDACRSIVDRIDPDALDHPGQLVDLRAELLLEEAATTFWSPVPGRPDQRVPTSRTAVDSVREAIAAARALGPTSEWTLTQIRSFEDAVVWASADTRLGGLIGPLGAVAGGLVLALHGVRNGGGFWLGAAMVWLGSAPLLAWAGTRPQWAVNASVVEGRFSVDDAYLALLSKAPPLLAPLGLGLRLVAHALLAPASVLWRSLSGGKFGPPLALLILAVFAFSQAPVLDTGAPDIEPETPAGPGPVRLAAGETPLAWTLGGPGTAGTSTVGGIEVTVEAPEGSVQGIVARSSTTEPVFVLEGWQAADPAQVSPAGAACEVSVQRFTAEPLRASVRTTRCAGPRWTVELRAR